MPVYHKCPICQGEMYDERDRDDNRLCIACANAEVVRLRERVQELEQAIRNGWLNLPGEYHDRNWKAACAYVALYDLWNMVNDGDDEPLNKVTK